MGLKAKSFIDAGQLVPDEVVIGIIKDRLAQNDCANGFILDGFPRTIPQAEALDEMGVEIDKVIDIEVPDEKITDRMSGRRVCKECGESYHVSTLNGATTCARCGGELYQRKDDNPETVGSRLKVYEEQTAPLIDYYTKKGIILNVTGTEAPAEVLFEQVKALLDDLAKRA